MSVFYRLAGSSNPEVVVVPGFFLFSVELLFPPDFNQPSSVTSPVPHLIHNQVRFQKQTLLFLPPIFETMLHFVFTTETFDSCCGLLSKSVSLFILFSRLRPTNKMNKQKVEYEKWQCCSRDSAALGTAGNCRSRIHLITFFTSTNLHSYEYNVLEVELSWSECDRLLPYQLRSLSVKDQLCLILCCCDWHKSEVWLRCLASCYPTLGR